LVSVRVPKVQPLSRAAIERIAESFVAKVSPESLSGSARLPVQKIVEFQLPDLFDVQFHVDDLPVGVEGRFEGNTLTLATEVYNELLQGLARPRFTVAHEIGHCALHRHILQLLNRAEHRGRVVLYRRDTVEAFRDPEWQANVFAGAALMPLGAVKSVQATLPAKFLRLLPDRVASKMGVSVEAAKVRISVLKARGQISL
jgi:hypothetical protein